MLDVTLVLQEAEALLDDHYVSWQQHGSSRIRVYQAAQKKQVPITVKTQDTRQPASSNQARAVALPPAAPVKTDKFGELVANIFMLVLLGVLSEKLARGGAR